MMCVMQSTYDHLVSLTGYFGCINGDTKAQNSEKVLRFGAQTPKKWGRKVVFQKPCQVPPITLRLNVIVIGTKVKKHGYFLKFACLQKLLFWGRLTLFFRWVTIQLTHLFFEPPTGANRPKRLKEKR